MKNVKRSVERENKNRANRVFDLILQITRRLNIIFQLILVLLVLLVTPVAINVLTC